MTEIINMVRRERGFDFTGFNPDMIARRVNKRLYATSSSDEKEYIEYLINNPGEFDHLIDALIIKTSGFFRDSLCFEILSKKVIPHLIDNNLKRGINEFRVWSAGCSTGEEPYSIAMLMKEYYKRSAPPINVNIFASDLSRSAITMAEKGEYGRESMQNVRLDQYWKNFTGDERVFTINEDIRNMVKFSFFDLTGKSRSVPSESIYGGFDLVLCRNVLIYYNTGYQEIIFRKLFNSLNNSGIMILGESEIPPPAYSERLTRFTELCKVYQKLPVNN